MAVDDTDSLRVPVIEERVRVDKIAVETDHLRVRTVVDTHTDLVEQVLQTGRLDVTRIPFDREVTDAPAPRQDGGTLIVSVVEERLVKRLFLVEEVHVTQTTRDETVSIPVALRRMRAVVEQDGPDNN